MNRFDYKDFYFPLIYFLFVCLFGAYLYHQNPNINLNFILPIAFLLIAVGIIIIYFSKNVESDNIYKLVFIIVLCFGLFNVFLTPMVDVCDESEHFWRSEITSQGVLVPEYKTIPNSNQSGYQTISALRDLYPNTGSTVFETDWDDRPINFTPSYTSSAFSQNPFYGYLAQAVGISLAKLLDLNNVWMLWLGRLCNLILYASICAFAVKKSPAFKPQLLIVACLPLALYQAASLSIDSFVNASSLLTIAYFLYMYASPKESLTYKHAAVFFVLATVGGLTKVTYLALAFLIFFVPKINFKNKNDYLFSRFGILIIILITLLWSIGYANPVLENSWRGAYFIQNHVDAKEQIMYVINHKDHAFRILSQLPASVFTVIEGYFSFANLPPYSSRLLAYLYAVFFGVVAFLYPNNIKINNKTRWGVFLVFLIIYLGIIGVQYLTWCSVGLPYISGIFGRYFIPLLSLIPIFLTLNNEKTHENANILIVTLAVGFIANSIILTLFNYYG